MNEQPAESVSQVFAVIFVAIAVISYFFSKPKPINLDYFEIGYIYDNAPQIHASNNIVVNKPEPKPKHIAKQQTRINNVVKYKKSKKVKKEFSQFEKDCINSLRSMGMTKTEAIKKTNHVFKIKQPKTIQDFIMEAFKRENN